MRPLALGLLVMLAVVAGMAGLEAIAHASTLNQPTRAACRALASWDHHRTPAALRAMLEASRHHGVSATVKTDITVIYTEKIQGDWYDLRYDVPLALRDCR